MTPRGPGTVVVQTPLRKLWVQVQRVATSMRQVQDSSGEVRGSNFLSSRVRRARNLRSTHITHPPSHRRRRTSSWCRYVGARAPGMLQEGLV